MVAQLELTCGGCEIKAETDAATATASAAGPLAQADRDQEMLAQQEKVAERQAALTERQLDTEVRRPADAERYRVEQEAEAERAADISEAEARKAASIARAEAEAETARLSGEAEKARRSALAEAEAIEGAKRGEAEKARRSALAEAEALAGRAKAFEHYNEAAVLLMMVEVLPNMAREVSAPMAAIDQLTVVSSDGAGDLSRTVTNNMVGTMEMLKNATGVDFKSLLARRVNGEDISDAAPAQASQHPLNQTVPTRRACRRLPRHLTLTDKHRCLRAVWCVRPTHQTRTDCTQNSCAGNAVE